MPVLALLCAWLRRGRERKDKKPVGNHAKVGGVGLGKALAVPATTGTPALPSRLLPHSSWASSFLLSHSWVTHKGTLNHTRHRELSVARYLAELPSPPPTNMPMASETD